MERITKNDAAFLIALNASEESSLSELRLDLQRWNHEETDVTEILLGLIRDGIVLLAERKIDSIADYSATESARLASRWFTSESNSIIIFLTDSGWERWDTDDWGITTERAKHLIFSKQGGINHVS